MRVALACSCGIGDLRDALSQADGAFVGELVEKGEPPTGGLVSSAHEISWTFRVETALKGELGSEVDVRSPWAGASCGFELGVGERVGVLLHVEDGEWHGGLCTQVGADALLSAAVSLGRAPVGVGTPVWFMVGGALVLLLGPLVLRRRTGRLR